ncbi:hypothetical protein [Spirosoma oryzicola]|uniref:hypothetical protein n=1 Tax=Spirosoma oryzicola TaxID=2898794 RepID=UPI001E3AD5E4|nr:hypothetical protein [Spirosoma oryzicola]UHG90215.1 hypothetical protein LQ777_18410 [Spirosoma oryzicola]
MQRKVYLLLSTLFTATLLSCSKSDDNVTPAVTVTPKSLARSWSFSDVSVKTQAKSYVIPSTIIKSADQRIFGDDNTITIDSAGTFSYLEDGNKMTGKWKLADANTLVLTEADGEKSNWKVNSITSTDIELASVNVDLTKGMTNGNTTVYSDEENNVGFLSLVLLTSLDKKVGGPFDMTNEPQPTSVQLIMKGKAK